MVHASNQKKVFVIGFNKCGTSSLNYFFNKNGMRSLHYNKGRLAIDILTNIRGFKNPVSGYEKFTCFLDMECIDSSVYPLVEAYKYYDELYRWNPSAKFILNTRNVERWITSRSKHSNGRYLDRYKYHYGFRTDEQVKDAWRIDFYQHHANVLKFFKDKPGKLLVYDIEQDSPVKISEFLSGFSSFDSLEMPKSNATKAK